MAILTYGQRKLELFQMRDVARTPGNSNYNPDKVITDNSQQSA
jgi:hypothetical protein